jgi:DNA-binding PadR family transcriptional regulator
MASPNDFLPLSPVSLHVLLALAMNDMHGYAIMQAVRLQSGERYQLGPGTLYDSLGRLLTQGLVKEAEAPDGETDSRRRYYQLAPIGRKVLDAELARLEEILELAKASRARPRERRA